jgi:hypothetical protein
VAQFVVGAAAGLEDYDVEGTTFAPSGSVK